MANIFARFGAWVAAVGGPTRAAELLECDVGHVVHISRARRRPGIELAVKIESRTRRMEGGAIRVSQWAGAKPLPRRAASSEGPKAA